MKIFSYTFGCKVNQYETELLRHRLTGPNDVQVDEIADADLCLINTCTVTSFADKEARQMIRRVLRENQHARTIVTGCYATRAPEEIKSISPRIEVYTNQQKEELPSCIGYEVSERPLGIHQFAGHTRAFLKIQDGCKAPCNYCIIPTVRPDMWSKPVEQVLAEAEALLKNGYQEIVLTGIRLGLYRGPVSNFIEVRRPGNLLSGASSEQNPSELTAPRRSLPAGRHGPLETCGDDEVKKKPSEKLDLVALLEKLVALPYHFRIRLSSLEVTEVTDRLIDFVKRTPKICRHFHIPMQSGDSEVLKAMQRWYDAPFYESRVQAVRAALPDCGITADVMVGYPTETEQQFQNTYDLINRNNLSGLHVFRFSAREGTKAADHKPLDPQVIISRATRLGQFDKELRRRFAERFQGSMREILPEPEGQGWSDNYIRVAVPVTEHRGLALYPVAAAF